jgi:hypothetical protein
MTRLLSMMGRNSLNVFCLGSLLSLAGQFTRYAMDASFVMDFVIIFTGVVMLAVTAWVSEWRHRLRAP